MKPLETSYVSIIVIVNGIIVVNTVIDTLYGLAVLETSYHNNTVKTLEIIDVIPSTTDVDGILQLQLSLE